MIKEIEEARKAEIVSLLIVS